MGISKDDKERFWKNKMVPSWGLQRLSENFIEEFQIKSRSQKFQSSKIL